MLDLDFSPEQEMLRQTDARRAGAALPARRRPRDGGRPDGLPALVVDPAGRARPHRPAAPARGARRLGHDAGRRRGPLRGVRAAPWPRSRTSSAPCSQRWGAGRGRPAKHRRRSGWAALPRARPSSPRPGSSRRTGSRRAASRSGPNPTASGGFRLSGVKRHVAFAAAADRLVVLARTGDDAEAIDLFLVDPTAVGVTLRQQFTIASDTQYEVTFDDVAVAGAGPDRRRRHGMGHLAGRARAGAGAPGRPGGRRRPLRPGDHHPVRQGPPAVRQAARRVPGPGPQPGRCGDHPGRGRAAGARSGVGRRQRTVAASSLAPMAKLFACRTFRDITAMAQQIFGGIGFTLDFDIQLYFRRAKQQQLMWSNDRSLEDAVAAALLD